MEKVKIIECPRDAMQGLHDFIPTKVKADYINHLLTVGFDTLDFGSFVSAKAIPQLKDTEEVLKLLNLSNTSTKLLAIIANERGAENASKFEEINYFGYPFSISETFQQRNTNTSIDGSLKRLENICNIASKSNQEVVTYLSMGFGNPYGDPWNPDIIIQWAERLNALLGIKILALSDTIGVANPTSITEILKSILPALPKVEIGVHLHTTSETYSEKVEAAYNAGCRRFDGAIRGFGGCPMAEDELVGNMPTEMMLHWFEKNNVSTGVNKQKLEQAIQMSMPIFN
ncbi:MAG: hydroxymethylglutaryl-CoA lyase [Brumimicrobium sp.]|nr:hydroxymethylglutaryl-CoA lyase [Brumimicrobium sp.]MCO5268281.1 hydroxymethylglutaryl-CoA lyase [Brumimicrobium sp.]